MSKNLKNIIKEVLNESDFDWIGEDLIKVGNCFIMNEYLRIQIDKIVFRLDSVGVPLVHRDFILNINVTTYMMVSMILQKLILK